MGADSSGYKLRAEADGAETPIRGGMVVGRGDDCDLVIRLGVVSRRHARLTLADDGALWVEDLGSTNGTTVNGEPVDKPTRVKPGDILCFDDVAYQVLGAGAPAPPEDRDRTIVGGRPLPAASSLEKTLETAPAATKPAPPAVPATAAPAAPIRLPDEPAPRSPPPRLRDRDSSPGIPQSWAESARLEASSHTQALPVLLRQISQKSGDTEGLIEAARQHANNRQPRLIGLNHAIAGDVFALDFSSGRSKWELGRDASADVRIPDDSVSGRHAQLIREQGRWKVVNLMSVNGTFVNGRKVLSAYLKTTDKIRLGNVELAFDAGDDVARGARAGGSSAGPLARLGAWLRRLFGRS